MFHDNNRVNWYKNQLSPLGQKVLQLLIERKNSDRLKQLEQPSNAAVKRQTRHNYHLKSFRDSTTYNVKETNKLSEIENINSISDDSTISAVDLYFTCDSRDIRREYNDSNRGDTVLSVPDKLLVAGPSRIQDDVAWNDMFDKELFPDDQLPTNENVIINKNEGNVYLHNIIEGNKENNKWHPTTENNDYNPQILPGNEVFKEPIQKPSKRKNKLRVTDENNKKAKKPTNPTISLRKEMYTKTVKNWLSDVDKSCMNEINDSEIIGQSVSKDSENEIMECKMKAKTKVVQAQLANKGGIMKYRKPEKVMEDHGSKEDTEVNKANTDTLKENITGKNNTIKFIPPIKSQLLVKDIKYNIITLEDNNIDNFIDLLTVDKQDVLIVIVYRNGFCQLNSNYTEDTCIPEGIVLNLNEQLFYVKAPEGRIKGIVSRILESNTVICYDSKIILIYLSQFFECRPTFILDLKIGGALIDPDNHPENFSDLQKLLLYTPEYTIATECTLQKVAWYTLLLRECMSKLKKILNEKLLWKIFVEVEMRLVPVIADMEKRGVSIDLEKLRAMEKVLTAKMKSVEEECYKVAGKKFQLNSQPQVRAILYDELRLDAKNNVRVRETLTTGAKSTSEAALRSLISLHPLPKLILEYRHLHKAYATFLAGISQHVKDGVVKPTWVQIAAATGRIACNNPNLQAIPKAPFNVVLFPESNDTVSTPLWFRSVYVARRGMSLLAADFRQVECRIFAFAAGDASLLAILHQDEDIFRALAAQWLKKSECAVSEAERERTKRVVYASLYGAGARKLADMLGQPYDQALTVLASFNRTFPSLKSFGQRVISSCEREEGLVRSLGGRARCLRDINSSDSSKRAHAQRQAVNYIVQGSAADLCKTAMVLTEERLQLAIPAVDAHLLLQIHDELVWEVADQDLERAADIIKNAMEGCGQHCGLPLRLPVAVTTGPDWAHMTPLPHI